MMPPQPPPDDSVTQPVETRPDWEFLRPTVVDEKVGTAIAAIFVCCFLVVVVICTFGFVVLTLREVFS